LRHTPIQFDAYPEAVTQDCPLWYGKGQLFLISLVYLNLQLWMMGPWNFSIQVMKHKPIH